MREHFTHWETMALRWGDMDALGHVNNAKYLVYLETARLNFLRQFGVWEHGLKPKLGPVLAHISCDFRKELTFPATIQIGSRVSRLGNKSFTLQQNIFREGRPEPLAETTSVVVWVEYATGKSVPLPEQFRRQARRLDGVEG